MADGWNQMDKLANNNAKPATRVVPAKKNSRPAKVAKGRKAAKAHRPHWHFLSKNIFVLKFKQKSPSCSSRSLALGDSERCEAALPESCAAAHDVCTRVDMSAGRGGWMAIFNKAPHPPTSYSRVTIADSQWTSICHWQTLPRN